MRIPKESTIRKHYMGYAYKAGFTVHPSQLPWYADRFDLFDIAMGYYTHRDITIDTMVKVIIDTLHQKKARLERAKV